MTRRMTQSINFPDRRPADNYRRIHEQLVNSLRVFRWREAGTPKFSSVVLDQPHPTPTPTSSVPLFLSQNAPTMHAASRLILLAFSFSSPTIIIMGDRGNSILDSQLVTFNKGCNRLAHGKIIFSP